MPRANEESRGITTKTHVSFLHDMMKKPYTRLQDTLQKNLHTLIDMLLALDTETLPLLSTINGPLHHITQTHTSMVHRISTEQTWALGQVKFP